VLKDGKIKFKSIGDLNIVNQNFTFVTTNYTVTYPSTVLMLEDQTIKFEVGDITGLSSLANLTWDGTQQTVSKTTPVGFETYSSIFNTPEVSANANVTFVWDYLLTYGTTTESGNITFIQEVLNLGIDNCSVFTTKAINYSIVNETSDALLIGSASANFKIWIDSSSNYKQVNLSWTDASTMGVCIQPASLNLTYYSQMEYIVDGQTKTYYIDGANLDNVTNYINLYISDEAELVTFTVIDENDNTLSNIVINVLSYDLGTDSYKTTEVIKTDSNGKALANIVLDTQFYKFLLQSDGTVVLETEPTKITSTTQTFQINLGDDYLNTYTSVNDMTCSMEFHNASKAFTYTFSDSSNTEVYGCLEIVRSSLNAETVINTSCLSSAAGTINLYIDEAVSDYTYYARGLVTTEGETFICADSSVSFNDTYKKFGREGIMATFLLVIALVTIGLWNPVVAVLLATVSLIASVFMGFFFLTPAILITYVILAGLIMFRMKQ